MFEQSSVLARRAIAEGTHHVYLTVGDTQMSAATRKLIGKLTDEYPKEYLDRAVGSYVIVTSALARGMMTALRWVSPALVKVDSVSDVEEAITAGLICLEKHQIAVDPQAVSGARRWLSRELQKINVEGPSSVG